MFKVPEKHRITTGTRWASYSTFGNNGAFFIPLSQRSEAWVIASDGEGWEHVSVHMLSDGIERTPTWAEMCRIKDIFWNDDDCVVQFHPPKSDYVNNHKHTLHLWRPIGKEILRPDAKLVGIV